MAAGGNYSSVLGRRVKHQFGPAVIVGQSRLLLVRSYGQCTTNAGQDLRACQALQTLTWQASTVTYCASAETISGLQAVIGRRRIELGRAIP